MPAFSKVLTLAATLQQAGSAAAAVLSSPALSVAPNYTAVIFSSHENISSISEWQWRDQQNGRQRHDLTLFPTPSSNPYTQNSPASSTLSTCIDNPNPSSGKDKLVYKVTIKWSNTSVTKAHPRPTLDSNFAKGDVDSCSVWTSNPLTFEDCQDYNGWAPLEGFNSDVPFKGTTRCMNAPSGSGNKCAKYYKETDDDDVCFHRNTYTYEYEVDEHWGWLPNGVETHKWHRNSALACADYGEKRQFLGVQPLPELPRALVEDFVDRLDAIGIKCRVS